jgi:arylsulfatase A-like enzyme
VKTTPVSAIRAGDWKLIEYLEDNRIELYNLTGDLKESKNLATEMPKKADELRTQLARWRADTHVQVPTPNPSFRPKR